MNPVDVLEISKSALFTLLKSGAPVMLVGMTIGLIVSLFQALTQIQEMTLTFVPKILSIFLALIAFSAYMSSVLFSFFEQVVDLMINGIG